MPDPKSVADAEAELAQAEADLAAAEQAQQAPVEDKSVVEKVADVVAPVKEGEPAPEEPAPHPDAEKSTEELLAAAPPLVLPHGTRLEKTCPNCGLRLDNPPANLVCPNCGTVVP